MKYLIIGLGNYGYSLAIELSALGNEVIVVDNKQSHIESIKDKVAAAFCLDATEEESLYVLPLQNLDAVVVTMGKSFAASVRVTALLKKLRVNHIFARANDEVHRSILQAFDIEGILSPEEDAAKDMVRYFEFGLDLEAFPIDEHYYVMKFKVPENLYGYYVNDLKLNDQFGLKLIALKRGKTLVNSLGVSFTEKEVVNQLPEEDHLLEGDELVVYGRYSDFQKFWRAM